MINLIPPARLTDLRLARSNTIFRRYIELVLISLAVVLLVLLGSYYFLRKDQQNTQNVLDIETAKANELQPYQQEAEDLSKLVSTIAGLSARDIKFSTMLTDLAKLMPTGARLTGIQISADDLNAPLVISAEIYSEDKAALLRNNILSSDLFARADIQSIKDIEDDKLTASNSATPTPATTATPTTPTTETQAAPASPYRYTVTIDAYFTKTKGDKK